MKSDTPSQAEVMDQPFSMAKLVAKHKLKAKEKEVQKEAKNEIDASVLEEVKEPGLLDAEKETDIIQLTSATFADLGVCPEICKACEGMGYKHPSKI